MTCLTASTDLGWNELPWEKGCSPLCKGCAKAEETPGRAAKEEARAQHGELDQRILEAPPDPEFL